MQLIGMEMPPASIDLPLGVSYPLYRRPALRVVVRGYGVPRVERGPTLEISALNTSASPVRVAGISASVIYTAFPPEILLGNRAPRLPLRELGGSSLPYVLEPGASASWSADLTQLSGLSPRPNLMPHTPFFEMSGSNMTAWHRYGRAGILARNLLVRLSRRRLAVGLLVGRGTAHKAKVRWQPPAWVRARLRGMIKDRAPGRWPRLLGRDLAIRKTVPGRRASEPETPFAALFRVLYAVELRKMPV